MNPSYDLVVAGEINPDIILSGDVEPVFGQAEKLVESAEITVGSSSVIFAMAAARLGLNVAFMGKCGDDLFGHFMLDAMQARGIDISPVILHPDQPTGFSVILNRPHDRAILTYPGLISSLQADDIPDALLARARHLHIASYFLQTALQPGLPQLFRRAHGAGLSISLDANWDPSGRWENFDALLRQVDVFLPNENEALAITRTANPEEALAHLARLGPTVAIKLGAAGAIARRGEEVARAQALSVPVADTVGAGDTFDAGFIYGLLHHWSLTRALQLAVVCGSLSTRSHGGVTAQPTLPQALAHLHS